MKTIAIILACCIVQNALASPTWWSSMFGMEEDTESSKPDFCNDYDCPTYKLLEKGDGYEVREYESVQWVTTDVEAEEKWEKRSKTRDSFHKLFRYISGSNAEGKKIDMTVPVLMSHTDNKVTMAFMLPHEYWSQVPVPTDPDVKLYKSPKQQVYVRSFGGFPYGFFNNKNYYKTNYEQLKEMLARDGKSYSTDMFFTTGYDSPWTMFNRHNEVWFLKN